MPPSKKKINVNTIANTEAKPIDSFFAPLIDDLNTANTAITINTNENLQYKNILQASTGLNNSNSTSNCNVKNISSIEIKENILKNLIQKKILYSHIDIKHKIECLSENEVIEIFKIIKHNNEKYSTNKNGIFINLSTLKKHTILEISNFLYFCDNNNRAIDEEEQERAKYKDMIYD